MPQEINFFTNPDGPVPGGRRGHLCLLCLRTLHQGPADRPEDLIPKAKIAAGATLVDAFLDAKNVLVY